MKKKIITKSKYYLTLKYHEILGRNGKEHTW